MVTLTGAVGIWIAQVVRHGEGAAVLPWSTIVVTLAATAMVVASANALNCWLERDVDRHMSRTKGRPLPAGRLNARIALVWGLSLGALSVPALAYFVNGLTALLALVALLSYVWVYTPLKRRSWTAVLVGAVPGAMPPLMGWTAVTGSIAAEGLALFGVLFLWQLPHFMAISVFRKEDYERAGIHVVPSVFGSTAAVRQSVVYAGMLIPVSLWLVPLGAAGGVYLSAALVLGLLFFGSALVGLMPRRSFDPVRWSRRVFFISLLYLPLLIVALVVDAVFRF